MKNIGKRAAAWIAAIGLCASCAMPVCAQSVNTEKEENVYVNLSAEGGVEQIYVVNLFTLKEDTVIQDHGRYSAVRNLTSEEEIRMTGDSVTVKAEAGAFYYQGELKDAQLPWLVRLEYTLDGRAVSARELAGANGHLVLHGMVTRNEKADERFYDSHMVQITILLDTVKCRSIRAEGATAANVSGNRQLTYMKLPGQELSFTVEADVTDFTMEGISLNAAPFTMDLASFDFSEMDSLIEEQQSGAKQLDDGANALWDGSKALADGAAALKTGADTAASGAAQLADGANALNSGAAELTAGTAELAGGLSTLSAQSGALREGAGTIFNSLLAAANTQFETLLPALGINYIPLTRDNYREALHEIEQQVGGKALETATEAARAKVTAETTAAVHTQVEQRVTQEVRAGVEVEVRKEEQTIRKRIRGFFCTRYQASLSRKS